MNLSRRFEELDSTSEGDFHSHRTKAAARGVVGQEVRIKTRSLSTPGTCTHSKRAFIRPLPSGKKVVVQHILNSLVRRMRLLPHHKIGVALEGFFIRRSQKADTQCTILPMLIIRKPVATFQFNPRLLQGSRRTTRTGLAAPLKGFRSRILFRLHQVYPMVSDLRGYRKPGLGLAVKVSPFSTSQCTLSLGSINMNSLR